MISWFKKKPIISFKNIVGGAYISPITQIKLAREEKPDWLLNQKGYNSDDKFQNCPGMMDWFGAGYIIPAWTDMTIKANKAGTVVKEVCHVGFPVDKMNLKLTTGMLDLDESVTYQITKIPCPWAIETKEGYSAHVIPPLFHSPLLKDLFIYPGTVDYDGFAQANFIFTAIRECEIFIPAGTPLLQVIPFKREVVNGVCAAADKRDVDRHAWVFATRVKAAYRKFFHKRKKYTLDVQV
jgi:hypothetical protein